MGRFRDQTEQLASSHLVKTHLYSLLPPHSAGKQAAKLLFYLLVLPAFWDLWISSHARSTFPRGMVLGQKDGKKKEKKKCRGMVVNSSHCVEQQAPEAPAAGRLVITVKAADKQENDGMIPSTIALSHRKADSPSSEGINHNRQRGRAARRPTCWEVSTNKPSGMPDADK